MCNVVHCGLQDHITPFPVPSSTAAKYFKHIGARPNYIFVDGSHQADDVWIDLNVWWEVLAPGGIIAGDDYRSWAGVTAAVDRFVREKNLFLEVDHVNFAIRKA
jgi:hypothetical protein